MNSRTLSPFTDNMMTVGQIINFTGTLSRIDVTTTDICSLLWILLEWLISLNLFKCSKSELIILWRNWEYNLNLPFNWRKHLVEFKMNFNWKTIREVITREVMTSTFANFCSSCSPLATVRCWSYSGCWRNTRSPEGSSLLRAVHRPTTFPISSRAYPRGSSVSLWKSSWTRGICCRRPSDVNV